MSITGSTFTQPKQAQGFTSFWPGALLALCMHILSTLTEQFTYTKYIDLYVFIRMLCIPAMTHTQVIYKECFAFFATVTNPCSLLGAKSGCLGFSLCVCERIAISCISSFNPLYRRLHATGIHIMLTNFQSLIDYEIWLVYFYSDKKTEFCRETWSMAYYTWANQENIKQKLWKITYFVTIENQFERFDAVNNKNCSIRLRIWYKFKIS